MSNINKIQGFNVISVKTSPTSTSLHYFFVKQHALREKTVHKPSDRTLFVLNVPSYCTEDTMKFAWEGCGPVETVYFHDKPNAGLPSVDESTFFPTPSPVMSSKGLSNALKHSSTIPLLLSSDNKAMSTGLEKWVEEYNKNRILNTDEMEKEITSYMAKYDAEEAGKMKVKDKDEEDDEGWTTVTKGGRHPGFARKENVTRKIKQIEEKKRSKKELLNFYSFQLRESKMKNLMALRKKFEEDKKKVAAFKQTRKFKPF